MKSARRKPYLVHVSSMTIRTNKKNGRREPPVIVKRNRSKTEYRTDRVEILDAQGRVVAEVVYTPDRPLSCGAVVYIVCHEGVRANTAQSVLGVECHSGVTPASSKNDSTTGPVTGSARAAALVRAE